ncbi:MAG: PqqD family peptide modification chaperone, partial [Deltaproteobacteria bacterium]|nr:PqqD family peptide modification chaperone [Deltaproteobacteria bacterium]
MIADESYPTRKSGVVMRWSGEDLLLRSKRDKASQSLINRTAATIWLFCDGQTRISEIIDRLQRHYPEQRQQVKTDILQAAAHLRARGLLDFAEAPQPVRPFVRVGFADFWPEFQVDDNYFLWMLTFKFDVMLVIPGDDTPDLLFCSTYPLNGFDLHQVDRARTHKILVSADMASPDFSAYDFAFSPHTVTGPFASRHCLLPLWSLYVDWDAYAQAGLPAGEKHFLAHYHPDRVCVRLYNALFAGSLPESEQEAGSPPPRTAGFHTRPRPPVFQDRPKKLTIGMATYDDFDGVYFTVQAIRLFHPEVTEDIEILVIDNHPQGACARPLQDLVAWIPNYRYVPYPDVQSTAVRDMIFRKACSEAVLCIDSHVMLAQGALRKLIAFMDNSPECRDLLQGPCLYDDLVEYSTHFEP